MKIFSAAQIKKWDAYTIAHEPIKAIDLMERAAQACTRWMMQHFSLHHPIQVFCGKGNNGGDGLAIARMLIQGQYKVTVYIVESENKGSPEFNANLEKLHHWDSQLQYISLNDHLPVIEERTVIIDALFGTGLNKPPEGVAANLISHINQYDVPIVSIDLPSGLFADYSSKANNVVGATYTLSFQNNKLAFLLPENEPYCGEVYLLDIGLHPAFEKEEEAAFEMTETGFIKKIYKPRKKFSHKGTYGHAVLITGSHGMMGASVLSARACLRSGAGKLTCYIPECGYEIMQSSVPEAMCITSGEDHLASVEEIAQFDAIGIGPGIGKYPSHTALLKDLLQTVKTPLLIDADALNMIAADKTLMASIPPLAVLTPHHREFERLFGPVSNDFERLQLALERSKEYRIYIVLKGHNTFISTPEGKGFFNSTGNAGMATAGSGDVLSGCITALLAQGYPPLEASLLGTYLHGLAGDIAAQRYSPEAMIAGDIVELMGEAFKQVS